MIHRTDIEYMAYTNYRIHCLEPIGSYIKHISLLIYLDVV
jgi:hypothetical protein